MVFGWTFVLVLVASIQHVIQFQVFGQSYWRTGRTNQFIYSSIITYSWCFWAHFIAIFDSFKINLWSCQCGQYSACNLFSGFFFLGGKSPRRRGRTNYFVNLLILADFQHSKAHLKTTSFWCGGKPVEGVAYHWVVL